MQASRLGPWFFGSPALTNALAKAFTTAWRVVALALLASAAQAVTLDGFKGNGMQSIYGRYAPAGDCTRLPRVTIDDSGFTFEVKGGREHSRRFEFAASYMGQGYEGIALWFFPFPRNDNDFGPVTMTVNADERPGKMVFESQLARGQKLPALPAALVAGSPYARCGGAAAAATPVPPPAPIAKKAPGLDWSALAANVGRYPGEFDLFDQGQVAAALRELIGAKIDVLRANLQVASPLQREGGVYALSGNAPHQGGEDMAYVLLDPVRRAAEVGLWEHGKLTVYRRRGVTIAPTADVRQLLANSPGTNAAPTGSASWSLVPVDGRTPLAQATAAASPGIQSFSVFCDHGRALVALLLTRPPKRQPLTFTLVFKGGLVNLSMVRGNREATFWQADPGATPLVKMLLQQDGVAYLRLNGEMHGEVSLAGAAKVVQKALASCRGRS